MAEQGTNPNQETRGEILLDRRTMDSITSYEVSDEQLTIIENSTSSNELNYAISLLSICVSLAVTLLTTKIEGSAKVAVFWCALMTSGILGSYFALEYRKKRGTSKNIFTKIRGQKSTRAIRENAEAETPVVEKSEEQS